MSLEYVGYVAAFLTTAAFFPQAIKTIKTRDTHALSLSMYSLFSAGVFCWLLYGFVINDYAIIGANLITLLLALSILFIKINNMLKHKDSAH